jgi:hypothetical protein
VLDTLVRLGVISREALAARVGISANELAGVLDRLQALGYAAPVEDGSDEYRAIAQTGG